ncbi:hypothetical protein DL96DRAFT_1612382 [Flagelloscypha sp. PMI_526]|nr:hypothetical protein DL96DRAFT_1612382 [Flagelloscypha sp. PMI_526]
MASAVADSSAAAESPSHASLLNRISDAPDDLPPPSPSPPRQDAAFQLEQSPPQRFRSGTPVLGFVPPERYPRPGLPMTQEQYDQAKDIILDLLGWGVSPEHLVSQGLSVATIYHVFTELHLRLPSNIDFSRFINGEPRPTAISQHGHDSLPARPLAAHPSLPARPGVSDDLALRIGGPADPSSLDVERQRKQELLARKAAQASRRSRVLHTEPSSSSERPTSPPLEAEMARPIDVDNFLSTISPPSTSIISDSPDTVVTSIPDTDQIMAPTFLRENTPQGLSSGIQRRGTKRPLAADFEDSYPRVVRHRSSGNFSGISVRRCVLEPDESDESDDEGAVAALQISNTRPVSPALGRPVTVLSSHTPSTNTPTTSNGANVSSQLQQTEHALELLRKKILAKEQAALLKRTTSAHIQTTPTPTPEQQLSVDVKKEESHDQILLKDLETAADDEPYEQSRTPPIIHIFIFFH